MSTITETNTRSVLLSQDQSTDLKKQWIVYDPPEEVSEWVQNLDGSISQKSDIGSPRKYGSGTILLNSTEINRNTTNIAMKVNPGKTYQTGIVFNFINDENFVIFSINQKSHRNDNCEVLILERQNGEFNKISSNIIEPNQLGEVHFEINQENDDTYFYIDEELIFTWHEFQLLEKTNIGLYSQHNTDAEFIELCFTYDIASSITQTIPPSPSGTQANETTPINTSTGDSETIQDRGDPLNASQRSTLPRIPYTAAEDYGAIDHNKIYGLNRYLTLAEPAAKSLVTYKEVLVVPLDSFYRSLYSDPTLDVNPPIMATSSREMIVHKLDYRPNRWYRDLKRVIDEIKFAEVELKLKEDIMSYYEFKSKQTVPRRASLLAVDKTNGIPEDIPETSIQFQLDRLRTSRQNYSLSFENLSDLHTQKQTIEREMQREGYQIEYIKYNEDGSLNIEKLSDEQISVTRLGYDFYIWKRTEAGDFKPVRIISEKSFSNDEEWTLLVSSLRDKLEDRITSNSLDRFDDRIGTLSNNTSKDKSTDNIDPIVQNKINDITREIQTKTNKRVDKVNEFDEKIAQWNKIIETFPDYSGYHSYEAGQYPGNTVTTAGIPVGVGERSDFVKWVRNQYKVGAVKTAFVSMYNANNASRHQLNDLFFEISEKGKLDLGSDGEWGYRVAIMTDTDEVLQSHEFFVSWKLGMVHLKKWVSGAWGFGHYDYWDEERRIYNYTNPTLTILSFFDNAKNSCDDQLSKVQGIKTVKLDEIDGEIRRLNDALATCEQDILINRRKLFMDVWNDPLKNGVTSYTFKTIMPNSDPLSEYLMIEQKKRQTIEGSDSQNEEEDDLLPLEISTFRFSSDGFYNEDGLSLSGYLERREQLGDTTDAIAVLPWFDEQGRMSDEILAAVLNPRQPAMVSHIDVLPSIKFVETYEIEIGWIGYGLGELSHSVNLFPGESKELVIEKETKMTTKKAESVDTEETAVRKITSSFENNVEFAFSAEQRYSSEKKVRDMKKVARDRSIAASTGSQNTTASQYGLEANVGYEGFGVNASVGAYAKGETSASASRQDARNDAYSASLDLENERASNQSKDMQKRNTAKTIRNVASDTSTNNKLSVIASSSTELDVSMRERETIKLENPNLGRTLNFNFFQLQNHYGTSTKLIDVKLVIDPGYEAIAGTGLHDVKVFEIEEFGKIFWNSNQNDPRTAILAAIIARQVFKHYGDFLPGVTSGNGAVTIPTGCKLNVESMQTLASLSYTSSTTSEDGKSTIEGSDLYILKEALDDLKSVPFVFQETILDSETVHAVNAGAFYVESELGRLTSTERYVEVRREIESAQQRAEVELIEAQAMKGRFFPTIPENVSTLSLDGRTLLNPKPKNSE